MMMARFRVLLERLLDYHELALASLVRWALASIGLALAPLVRSLLLSSQLM